MANAAVLVAEDGEDDTIELPIACPICGRETIWRVGAEAFPQCCGDGAEDDR